MRIENICKNTYYIDTGHGLITFYKINDRDIILIDSGFNRGDEIIDLLDKNRLNVKTIIFTHPHIDHVSNNQLFYDRYNCEILIQSADINSFIKRRSPKYPYKHIELAPVMDICGVKMRTIHTPGHCPDHYLIITPDDVCCVGDALISLSMINVFKLPYIEDVELAMLSMEQIRGLDFPYYVISHKGVITKDEVSEVVEINIRKELGLYDVLRHQVTEEITIENVITKFMLALNISEKRINELHYMRELIKARIRTLAEAGEFKIVGSSVIPNKNTEQ